MTKNKAIKKKINKWNIKLFFVIQRNCWCFDMNILGHCDPPQQCIHSWCFLMVYWSCLKWTIIRIRLHQINKGYHYHTSYKWLSNYHILYFSSGHYGKNLSVLFRGGMSFLLKMDDVSYMIRYVYLKPYLRNQKVLNDSFETHGTTCLLEI